jgi:hypothetical protein
MLTPNYQLDPFTMDYSGFIPTGPITPTSTEGTKLTDRAIGIQSLNPGMTYAEALDYAKAEMGMQSNSKKE